VRLDFCLDFFARLGLLLSFFGHHRLFVGVPGFLVLRPRTLVARLTFSSHLQPSLFTGDVAASGCGAGFFRPFNVFALDEPGLHMSGFALGVEPNLAAKATAANTQSHQKVSKVYRNNYLMAA
jgi:hypothetical protein